ncbi:MAG: alkyl hydroperoxide reductase/Thiol specific antioxidant/Mal allergen [Dactylosporangium sp.]|nr:alkyl hydroperoxide reductase/Thiol specific antioxidant/Mal allergen [Dactylosporangium sp.]
MTPRVRAPELRGRAWLNTGGRELTLADLRGKITLLDFWTFCCVNCLHVLDELRPLEDKYADVLVTIGVHSPKFEHEKDPQALAAAVERYGVSHPVLDDPTMRMWQEYAAKAWPTLTVIDPEGYVVASMAGEGHAEGLARLFDELIAAHEAKGTLRRGEAADVPVNEPPTALRFPGKAAVLEGGTFLVADSAQHSLVELAADGQTELRRIGTGRRGRTDGKPGAAEFSEPSGLCVLPPRVAELAGYDVVVADTVNHLLRGVRLDTGEVYTVAGSGRQWRGTVDCDTHDALAVDLSSPWDVAYFDGRVVIAMAGIHQLWWFDPATRTAGTYAGTTVEALRDGPLHEAWMAQPSGLSTSPDGTTLWIADSESSALRWIADGELHTAVGQGLFDFGHVDGPAAGALLQHPLGVLALTDGTVLVADTYNGAVRRYDPATRLVTTVAIGLAEPSDLVSTTAAEVYVVESAAHRLVRIDADAVVDDVQGARQRTERPVTDLAPGEVVLDVVFSPAPGQKLDDSFGPPTRLQVSTSPPDLLVEGAGEGSDLRRRLVVSESVGTGVLQVVAQAATCDADSAHAACHLTRQDWGVPVRVVTGGAARLPLVLRGLDTD